MYHRSFPDRQVKVRFNGKGRQCLHQVPDEQIEPQVIDDDAVDNCDRIIVRKHLPEDRIDENTEHQQVQDHQQKKKADEDIGDEVSLPDRRTGILFPLVCEKDSEQHIWKD